MLPTPPKVLDVITVLSGGVGAARLLGALGRVTDPASLTAVVNVGDDLILHGLTICPDLDTITYTLAGIHDAERGWGLVDESWRVMERLAHLGGEAWFSLGDLDLATHLYRTQRIHEGATKSEVASELASRLGVAVRLLPVTNDPLATLLDTAEGRLSFQEYFVHRRHDVVVHSVCVEGAAVARPLPEALSALESAARIVIAPSNPVLSIDPILQVPQVRDILQRRHRDVVAVSPLIRGAALKGPADRLLTELGHESSCVGVADFYRGLIGTIVIDEADAARVPELRERGLDVRVTTTVMAVPAHAERLAHAVLS